MTITHNKPCDLGRALGENMARFADHAEQEWREQMGFVPVRCASCAFTKGTFPNGCLGTQADATKALMERKPFYCHHKDSHGNLPLCAGWLMLGDPSKPPVKVPWDYTGVER